MGRHQDHRLAGWPTAWDLLEKYPKCKFVENAVLRTGDVKPPSTRDFNLLSRSGGACLRPHGIADGAFSTSGWGGPQLAVGSVVDR